jgi:hypothetical protein
MASRISHQSAHGPLRTAFVLLATPRRRKFLDKSLDFGAAAEKDEGNEFAAPRGPRLVPIAQTVGAGGLNRFCSIGPEG